MCEIQFAISNRNIIGGDIKNLLNMGYANGNKDATGFLALNNEGWNWAKAKGDFWKLMETNGNCKKLLATSTAIIGHNRFTTTGSAEANDNNHPFVVDDWVLIHNGVLWSDATARKIIDDFDSIRPEYSHIETDSFAFFKVFLSFIGHETSNDAVHSAVQNTINLHNGDFSIFITNTVTNCGYYFRCGQRHFYFKGYTNGDTWKILGSTTEENMSLLARSKTAGLFRQISVSAMYEFVPDKNVFYVIDYTAEKMSDVIKKHDTLKVAERERIYWENEVVAPDEEIFEDFYPAVHKFLEKHGVRFDDIEWIDDDCAYIMHGFTQNELAELELTCETEDIFLSAIHGDYVEFMLKSWNKPVKDYDEENAWRYYDGTY